MTEPNTDADIEQSNVKRELQELRKQNGKSEPDSKLSRLRKEMLEWKDKITNNMGYYK